MAKKEWLIKLCWNGSKRQVEDTLVFDSRREWRFAIDTMPFDILDETDRICYVDYGDNDDWEG